MKEDENEKIDNEERIKEENKAKGKSNIILIILLMLFFVALAFGCGIILGQKLGDNKKEIKNESKENEVVEKDDNTVENEPENTTEENELEQKEEKEEKDSKAHSTLKEKRNEFDYVYVPTVRDNDFGVEVSILQNRKDIEIVIDNDRIKDMYLIDIGSENFSKILTFNKKVNQVFFGHFGQANGGEHIFFVMEDGTVEYIPLFEELNKKDWISLSDSKKMNSHGQIKGVTDVIYLYNLSVESGLSGYYSVGATRKDGTFYDLNDFLDNME